MEVFYTYKAIADLKQLSKDTQKRIAEKMRFYASQKNLLKFAKCLVNSDEGEFRFRIGDYRVFFDVINNKIFVLRIIHRGKSYEK